jgi:hypothetical protein
MLRDKSHLSRVGQNGGSEADGAREWLLSHLQLSNQFIQAVNETHPSIWFHRVMHLIVQAIEEGNQTAIELGCFYISEDPKAPFGRILKRRVMNALRRNVTQIPKAWHQRLINAHSRMKALPYPPHELKDLGRLVRALVPAHPSTDPT